MELRPGYKKTEIGVIPEDWDDQALIELKPFITSGSRSWAKYYSDRGDLFVRITNLSRSNIYLDLSDIKSVNVPPEDSEARRTALKVGDLLISITADIGIIGYVDNGVPSPAYINQHVACVRIEAETIEPKFIAYFLASGPSQERFRSITDVGAKTGINLTTVGNIRTAIPPLSEQRFIARALSDADDLITALTRLIIKKRDLRQGTMQRLLTGQTRLPGFGANMRGYKVSDVGMIPEDWDAASLGSLGETLIGLTYSPTQVASSGILVLRSSNIQNDALSFSDNVYVKAVVPEKIIVRSGDVLICVRNGSRALIGKSALLDSRVEGMTFGAFMAIFRSEIGGLVSYLFQSSILKRQIDEHLGATINQITNKSLNSFKIPLPRDPLERTAISLALQDMDAEITAIEAHLDKTRALKQAMMQALLTGRVRLPLRSDAAPQTKKAAHV